MVRAGSKGTRPVVKSADITISLRQPIVRLPRTRTIVTFRHQNAGTLPDYQQPSLSNGPGIERRVFIDPSYKRPQYLGPPAGRPTHRRSISLDRYEHSVPEPRLRTEPPKFPDALCTTQKGPNSAQLLPITAIPQNLLWRPSKVSKANS